MDELSVKQRIREVLENKGSNPTPDVSAEWLLRGKGDMFIQPIELTPEWNAKVDFVNEKEIMIKLK